MSDEEPDPLIVDKIKKRPPPPPKYKTVVMDRYDCIEFVEGKLRAFYAWDTPLLHWKSASEICVEMGMTPNRSNACKIGHAIKSLNRLHRVTYRNQRLLKVPKRAIQKQFEVDSTSPEGESRPISDNLPAVDV